MYVAVNAMIRDIAVSVDFDSFMLRSLVNVRKG